MDANYWLGRWKRGETGWHQSEVEPALIHWMEGTSHQSVFVPLCGKSKDMKWLIDQGHTVLGCELSPQACEAFFRENALEFQTEDRGALKVFRGENVTLLCGDIFTLTSADIGTVDRVYDRAALIALPPEVRPRYSAHLLKLLENSLQNSSFEFLQIILERNPPDEVGPPFSVSPEEVRSHYGSRMTISPVSREVVTAKGPPGSVVHECVFLLQTRS